MEYTPETILHARGNSHFVIQKILLFGVTVMMIAIFSFYQKKIHSGPAIPPTTQVEMIEKSSKNEMSAIKFTAMPFILAFKHFIVEREE
jgi:hypothetical protein